MWIQKFCEVFFNAARWGIFPSFIHISGKTDGIFMKISVTVMDKAVSVKF